MSYWVLTVNSTVIARTTVQRVTSLEMQQGHMKEKTLAFDKAIRDKIKDSDHIILEGGKTQPHDWTDHPSRMTQTSRKNSMVSYPITK